MIMRLRPVAVAAALIATLLSVTSVTYAEGPDYDDPRVVRESVDGLATVVDRVETVPRSAASEVVIAYAKVAMVETVSRSLSGSSQDGCSVHSKTVRGVNGFGKTVWAYTSRTEWCWNGTEITSEPFFTPIVKVMAPLWEFVEHVDGYESGGVGDWMHEDYTRGHFRLCMVGLGKDRCIQHSYPEIHKRQYGNGQSQAW